MKYTQETINAVSARTGLMPVAIAGILEALESTDEQKAVRVDAERYRHFRLTFGLAIWGEGGQIAWHEDEIDQVIDTDIDKARGA